MSVTDEIREQIDFVMQEEEKKKARLKRRANPTHKAYMNRRHPTYIAVLAAKILMRFGYGRTPDKLNGNGNAAIKEDVTLFTIVGQDVGRFKHWLFNGNNHKFPKMKPTDKWDDWKDYFDTSAPINVPPRYDSVPSPEPEPEKIIPEFPEMTPEIDPDIEAFFEDPEVEVQV